MPRIRQDKLAPRVREVLDAHQELLRLDALIVQAQHRRYCLFIRLSLEELEQAWAAMGLAGAR